MKSSVRALVLAMGLLGAGASFAQTSPVAAAVNAATTSATTTATAAANSAASKAATDATNMAKAKVSTASDKPAMPATKVAAGGGAGKVWANSGSKRYHCEGSKFYGKTKVGEYMSEADAKGKGFRSAKGQACAS